MIHWLWAVSAFFAGLAIAAYLGKKACLAVISIYQSAMFRYRERYDELWDAHIAVVRQVMGDDEINRIFEQHGFGHDGRRK